MNESLLLRLAAASLAVAFVASGCTPTGGGGSDEPPVMIMPEEMPPEEMPPEEMPPEEMPPVEMPPEEMPPEEMPPEEMPPEGFSCAEGANDFENPVFERLRSEADAVRYLSFSSLEAPSRALIVEFRTDRGPGPQVGTVDLENFDLNTCTVCVFAIEGLNPSTGDRVATLLPTSGTLEITAVGGVGETLEAEFRGVKFESFNIQQGGIGQDLSITPIEDGPKLCADGRTIEAIITPTPAEIGGDIHNFQLQNCETEEFVDVQAFGEDTRAIWFVGTAGWCPACRQYLPQVFGLMADVPKTQAKLMVVLGENAAYNEPTLSYCRRHAEHYGLDDASMLYIDHDGVSSFATLFGHIAVYTDAQGAFGLPWNGIISGGGGDGEAMRYLFSDRSGQPEDLPTILREHAGINIQ